MKIRSLLSLIAIISLVQVSPANAQLSGASTGFINDSSIIMCHRICLQNREEFELDCSNPYVVWYFCHTFLLAELLDGSTPGEFDRVGGAVGPND